jgi:phosphoribosylanthranilate isomerase
MVRVKICGITNLTDAKNAVNYGACALGFVFAPSKRQVTAAVVRGITRELPPLVTKIGVFVDEDPLVIKELLRDCRLDLAQLHGAETPESCESLEGRVIKVFKAGRDRPDQAWRDAPLRAVLIDTYSAAAAGGTGERFDWKLFGEYRALGFPLILAGGLNPVNIGAALRIAQPDAVDVSSGVEQAPGKKDVTKIKELMEAIICQTREIGILGSTADVLCRKP